MRLSIDNGQGADRGEPVPGTAETAGQTLPETGDRAGKAVPGTEQVGPETLLARALDRFDGLLAERGLRLTAARRAIVEVVLGRAGHFAIEDLVAELRSRGLPASKATVYRSLPLLTEAGILSSAVLTRDEHTYERAVGREHHDHLVCRGCGKVVEFEYEAIEVLQREVAARYGFTLEGHVHQLIGRCAECRGRCGA
jgi:Fur family ferric uptake transcriptional regulator